MYTLAIIINRDSFGQGNGEIGYTLLGTFLRKVLASYNKPDVIIFYNSGVKLLCKESRFKEILCALEERGVDLIACGTCVQSHCGKENLSVGRISNMDEIADVILSAKKVVTL